MSKEKRQTKRSMLASDVMAELAVDSVYQERMAERKNEQEKRVIRSAASAAQIVKDLSSVGVMVKDLADARSLDPSHYRAAIPVLGRHLYSLQEDLDKETIASLMASWGAPEAAPYLLGEFAKLPLESPVKWKLADAISECTADESFDGIAQLVTDPKHGKAREMLALALAKIPTSASVKLLIALLKDDEVCGHALMALGRLKAIDAVDSIRPLLAHRKPWVRTEAERALTSIRAQ